MKKFWKILIVIAVAVYLFCFFKYLKTPITSEIVKNGTIENTVSVSGYVARDEKLIQSEFSGVLQNNVQEGETVAKGQDVATVYKGKVDQKIQSALTLVQQKIEELNASSGLSNLDGDGVKVESQIKEKIDEMITASNQRQFDTVLKAQTDIHKLSDKMQMIQGGTNPTTLEQLQNEKRALQQQINLEKADIYAPDSGVYSTHIDGLESLVDFANVSKLTVSDYDKLEKAKASQKNEVVAGQPVAKIIHDFDWQLITVVDADLVKDMKAGDWINIRIPDYGETVFQAQITAIKPDQNNKTLLAICCNKASEFISDNRNINVDLIFQKFEGLKIPSSALAESNGKQGVFVKSESFLKFKEVEVLTEQDGFAIIKEDNMNNDNLLLYDEVATNSKNLYDGKVVN